MLYIRITSDVSYDDIYYTLDGTNPTRESTKYTGPFPVYNDCEVRAIAVKDEWIDSEVSSLFVEVSSATPEVSRRAGTASDNCYIDVINTSDYEGAEDIRFYYTTDGTQPDENSSSFPLGSSLWIDKNCIVKMISGGEKSSPSIGTVEITIDDLKCQTPSIATYYDAISNTIRAICSSPTKRATLYYTLDGSIPGNESFVYAGEFSIDHNCTLKVVADTNDLLISDIAESNILVTLPTPSLYFDSSNRTITISNLGDFDLADTIFYYTTNGLEPNNTSNVYNQLEGILASGGSVVKVKAVASSGISSSTAELEVPYVYYTVLFDSNGGTPVEFQSVREGGLVKEPVAPTKEGFEFIHWYKDQEEVPYDFNTPVTSEFTLYARWSQIEEPEPPVDEGTLAIVGKARVGKAIIGKTE